MFTLRIIFYGLIALVDDGRTEGALALLVNAPHHESSIWMLDGKCKKGDCYRNVRDLRPNPIPREELVARYRKIGFNMAWFLEQEELSFEPFVSQTLKESAPVVFSEGIPSFPRTAAEGRSIVWVPSLSKIAPTAGPLRSDCLGVPNGCPVAARVEVKKGLVNSCHLVHEGDGKTAEVHAFDFRPAGAAEAASVGSPQAIADAVMVELKVKGRGLRLSARPFDAAPGAAPVSVKLSPRKGQITLIVSNNDYSGEGSHSHFEHYYHLTNGSFRDTSGMPIPHARFKQQLSPGACEALLDKFETQLGVADIDGVHNHRECDMTQITAP